MAKNKLKLPNLHKYLSKDDDTIYNNIFIKDYHAIVTDIFDMIIVDLKTYFTMKAEGPEAQELIDMLDVLLYLDGKIVSGYYWEELTKGDDIEISEEDYLIINSKGVSKELHYIEPGLDDGKSIEDIFNGIHKIIKKISVKSAEPVKVLNIRQSFLASLNTVFGTQIKEDNIIIENMGLDKANRFTFNVNRHIFGILSNNYGINEELFISTSMESFVKGIIKS